MSSFANLRLDVVVASATPRLPASRYLDSALAGPGSPGHECQRQDHTGQRDGGRDHQGEVHPVHEGRAHRLEQRRRAGYEKPHIGDRLPVPELAPASGFDQAEPVLEDVYFTAMAGHIGRHREPATAS